MLDFIREMTIQDGTIISVDLARQYLNVLLIGARNRNLDLVSVSEKGLPLIIGNLLEDRISQDLGEQVPEISLGYLEVFFANGLDTGMILEWDDGTQLPLFLYAFRARNYPAMKMIMNQSGFRYTPELLRTINSEMSLIDEVRESLLSKITGQTQRKRCRYDLE